MEIGIRTGMLPWFLLSVSILTSTDCCTRKMVKILHGCTMDIQHEELTLTDPDDTKRMIPREFSELMLRPDHFHGSKETRRCLRICLQSSSFEHEVG